MTCMLALLNNTFLGTLLAGSLLALFGLFLYRRQKEIDIRYEDRKKIRELASLLFANIDIAVKEFRGQLNVYDGKNPQLKLISDAVNAKFSNALRTDSDRRFNEHVGAIEKALNNLVAQLKIYEGDKNYTTTGLLTEKTSMLNVYLLGFSVLGNLEQKEVLELKNGFEETVSAINNTLQDLIKQKI